MKRKALMALLLGCAVLTAGCGSKTKETEAPAAAAEEAATEAGADTSTEADNKTASAEETEEEGTEAETEAEEVTLVRPTYRALDYVTIDDEEYRNLTVEASPVEAVTDEEVEETIQSYIEMYGYYEDITEGTVQEGDLVNIDFVGKKDGEAFDGGSAEGYELEIGSGTFIDGFEEGLIGVEVGSTVDLNLTFPEDYGSEELAGQDVVFTVTVNSIEVLSELTDEVAADLSDGESETADEYRAQVRAELEESNEQARQTEVDYAIMDKLQELYPITEYPQEMLDYMAGSLRQTYEQYAAMYGMEFADFCTAYFGIDEAAFDEEAMESAKASVAQELLLKAVAEKEGLDEITDEDYEQCCADYAEMYGYEDAAALQDTFEEETIRISIIMDRAIDFLEEHTTVVDAPEETESEEVIAVEDAVEAASEAAEEAAEEVSEAAEEVAEAASEAAEEAAETVSEAAEDVAEAISEAAEAESES